MAIRRAKQKEQVIARLSASAPPGETFVACVHGETGPSPWLNGIFDQMQGPAAASQSNDQVLNDIMVTHIVTMQQLDIYYDNL